MRIITSAFSSASAEIPQTMSYQGVLEDQAGQPVPDGNYQVTFKIYTVPSGGTALWSEAQTVAVADGIFSTLLGGSQPLSLGFDVPYWLGVRLGSDPEFTPRVALAAAPYALRAQVAEVGEDADWAISGNNIYRLSGMVGIGTSAPQKRLHISEQSSGSLAYGLKLENGGTASGTAIGLVFKVDGGNEDRGKGAIVYERTSTWNRGDLHILQDANGNYDLPDVADAAVTVKNNGNVGVGTRTPAAKLSVNGLARIESLAWPAVGTGMELGYSSGQHKGYVQVYDRDTDTWGDLFLGNGNVGIGNAYPAEKLQVNGVIYSMSGGLKFPDGTVQTTAGGGGGGGLSLPYAGTAATSGPAFAVTNTGSGDGIQATTSGATAMLGTTSNGNGVGVKGESPNIGVWGEGGNYYGVYGHSGLRYGVYGLSTNDYGVFGQSVNAAGVAGSLQGSPAKGYLGYREGSYHRGVYGEHTTYGTHGYLGGSFVGVYGYGPDGLTGVLGEAEGPTAMAVAGDLYSGGVIRTSGALGQDIGYVGWVGVRGTALNSGDLAGYFHGDVEVTGWLSKPIGSFKIDHPLDPTNKNLYHSFVESPDMMNIYNGNTTLDENGEAWIELPDWFEALNRDFRYQLTPIGAPGPNLYVAEAVRGNQFKIAGGVSGMTVSWQVTGIRHDPYAEQHRIPVEQEKRPAHRGKYLYPKEYGMPASMGVHYDPQLEAGGTNQE